MERIWRGLEHGGAVRRFGWYLSRKWARAPGAKLTQVGAEPGLRGVARGSGGRGEEAPHEETSRSGGRSKFARRIGGPCHAARRVYGHSGIFARA